MRENDDLGKVGAGWGRCLSPRRWSWRALRAAGRHCCDHHCYQSRGVATTQFLANRADHRRHLQVVSGGSTSRRLQLATGGDSTSEYIAG
jgi:hypothetical protein